MDGRVGRSKLIEARRKRGICTRLYSLRVRKSLYSYSERTHLARASDDLDTSLNCPRSVRNDHINYLPAIAGDHSGVRSEKTA